MTYEDYLYHHGILGQKWGVRRYQNPDGSLTEAGRRRQRKLDKQASKDEGLDTRKKKTKKLIKNRHNLSTEELKELNDRLRLEKNIKDLADEDLTYGKTKFKKAIVDAGAKAVQDIATTATTTLAKKALARIIPDDMVELMFGKEYRVNPKVKTELEKLKEQYDLEKTKADLADRQYANKHRKDIERTLDAKRAAEYYKNLDESKKSRESYEGKKSELDNIRDETDRLNALNSLYKAQTTYEKNEREKNSAQKEGQSYANELLEAPKTLASVDPTIGFLGERWVKEKK